MDKTITLTTLFPRFKINIIFAVILYSRTSNIVPNIKAWTIQKKKRELTLLVQLDYSVDFLVDFNSKLVGESSLGQ